MPKPKRRRQQLPRAYTFAISVTFDRGCRQLHALREVRDNIYGEHYCTPFNDGDPETFRVRSVRLRRRR